MPRLPASTSSRLRQIEQRLARIERSLGLDVEDLRDELRAELADALGLVDDRGRKPETPHDPEGP